MECGCPICRFLFFLLTIVQTAVASDCIFDQIKPTTIEQVAVSYGDDHLRSRRDVTMDSLYRPLRVKPFLLHVMPGIDKNRLMLIVNSTIEKTNKLFSGKNAHKTVASYINAICPSLPIFVEIMNYNKITKMQELTII